MEDTGLGPLAKATFKMVRGSEQYLVKVDKENEGCDMSWKLRKLGTMRMYQRLL